MKKIYKLLFTLVISFVAITGVSAKMIGLEDIAAQFNESKTINQYETLFGMDMVASVEDNKLVITVTEDEDVSTIKYQLNDSILSYDSHTESDSMIAYFIADALDQVYGEKDGAFLESVTLFTDEIDAYTLENEGFEITEANNFYVAKIDIYKVIPIIPLSEFYFKPEEFDFVKDIIEDESVGNQTGANSIMAYNVVIGEDTDEIIIGEVDGLTERSYKSILSALEVMYGERAVEDFKEVYPSFDEGSYILDGYEIMLEEEVEGQLFQDKVNVIVTIDKGYAKDMFLRTEYIGEEIDGGDKEITLDFANNESYTLGFFDSVSENDAAFLFKYVLEPAYYESGTSIVDNTIYYNVVDGKVVVSDKDNSVFKLVIGDEDIKLISTSTTDEVATHSVKASEYDNCDYFHQHVRYIKYNLMVNLLNNYSVIKGDNQTIKSTDKLEIEFSIDYDKFKTSGEVYVDNNLVDPKNYDSSKGSTIITFKNSYLKTLTSGSHEIKVVTSTGEVKTTFNLTKINNPDTGDNIITYISLLGLSIISITGIGIYNKKKLYN